MGLEDIVTQTYRQYAGKTLVERLWEEADEFYAVYLDSVGVARKVNRGRLDGMVAALAIMCSMTEQGVRAQIKERHG